MEAKLQRIQALLTDLIWTDYDRISMDGQDAINELCKELNIKLEN
jgi:hypothetical protein